MGLAGRICLVAGAARLLQPRAQRPLLRRRHHRTKRARHRRRDRPYFRSGYYIVYRKDSGLNLSSLADTTFRRLRIGVHILNSDAENTPPAMALSTYGVVGNLVGFPDQLQRHVPPGRHLQGAASDSIDVAIVWGPIAGYFVQQSKVPLVMNKVAEDTVQGIPFVYSMGMGVRRRDTELPGQPPGRDRRQAAAIW